MKKTAEGLVLYAEKQVGKPYWYGTFGQRSSLELLAQKQKQYPKYYTASDFKNQLGVKVHDCIGLIKGYIWCEDADDYNPKYSSNGCPDVNEAMMYNEATVKGDISTMPDTPGICVLKQGHIGVYIGGGEVIEARGHNYGVVKTKLKNRGWTKWCECPYIEYNKSEIESESKSKSESKNEGKNEGKTESKSKTAYVKVKTNGSGLNCRKKPKIISKILTTFPNGKKLLLIEKTTKKWYKVSDGKTTGYAYAKWLKEV